MDHALNTIHLGLELLCAIMSLDALVTQELDSVKRFRRSHVVGFSDPAQAKPISPSMLRRVALGVRRPQGFRGRWETEEALSARSCRLFWLARGSQREKKGNHMQEHDSSRYPKCVKRCCGAAQRRRPACYQALLLLLGMDLRF